MQALFDKHKCKDAQTPLVSNFGVRHDAIVIGLGGGLLGEVAALLQVLEDNRCTIIYTQELTIRKTPDLPQIELITPPKKQPISHGPQRKGRGGKLLRW